jgi:hypothetical protein
VNFKRQIIPPAANGKATISGNQLTGWMALLPLKKSGKKTSTSSPTPFDKASQNRRWFPACHPNTSEKTIIALFVFFPSFLGEQYIDIDSKVPFDGIETTFPAGSAAVNGS